MKLAFKNCRVITGTRQPKSIRRLLIRSKFSFKKKKQNPSRLFNWYGCKYHKKSYIKACKSFTSGKRNQFSWKYTRYFTCDRTNGIYVQKCRKCWKFYIGETKDFKKRVVLHFPFHLIGCLLPFPCRSL